MVNLTRHSPWPYTPSIAAAVIFILLFLALTSAQCWRIWRTKAKYTFVFALGGFFEFVGYAARASARHKMDRLMPYIIQNFFILVAPALFAASIYMTLGRIMRAVHGENYSLIRYAWLTKLFVGGDILSFAVQGGAAPLMVIAEQRYLKIGEGIVIAGLLIQVLMFGLFIVTSLVFERRMLRRPTTISLENNDWRSTMKMLYSVSALIMVRSVFRVVEYSMGYGGYLLQHEWPLYIFDALLMSGVMALFFWKSPGKLSSSDRNTSIPDEDIHISGYERHLIGRKP